MAAALAVFAWLDMPIVYMSNRWSRTNHPPPMIGTPNLNPDMQKVLLWNMLAFVMFGLLVAWFRYDIERPGQVINVLHIQKPARGFLAMMMAAPPLLLFVDDKLLHSKMLHHRSLPAPSLP